MIVSCFECGKEISNKAKICPHCGYEPLQDALIIKETEAEVRKRKKQELKEVKLERENHLSKLEAVRRARIKINLTFLTVPLLFWLGWTFMINDTVFLGLLIIIVSFIWFFVLLLMRIGVYAHKSDLIKDKEYSEEEMQDLEHEIRKINN